MKAAPPYDWFRTSEDHLELDLIELGCFLVASLHEKSRNN